jgi:hypothetical protein
VLTAAVEDGTTRNGVSLSDDIVREGATADPSKPNRLLVLTWVGAACPTGGVVSTGIALLVN